MPKTIESFWCNNPRKWPASMRAAFGKNITEMGCAYFLASSSEKIAFLNMCRDLSIELRGPTRYLTIEQDELASYPFYYLNTEMDDAIRGNDFLDFSGGCAGGPAIGRCDTGVVQKLPITLDGYKPSADIVGVYSNSSSRMLLVSRRLMTAIMSLNATGVEFRPCGDQNTEFFQMCILARVFAAPDVGEVKISIACPTCGRLYGYRTEYRERFAADSLAPVDFQVYQTIRSGHRVYLTGEIAIVSSRIQMLLSNKPFTGRAPYCTDPPVEFGIVDVDQKSKL